MTNGGHYRFSAVLQKLVDNDSTIKEGAVKGIIDELINSESEILTKQQELINSTQELADISAKLIAEQNLKNLEPMLIPVKMQLEELSENIADLQEKIRLSNSLQVNSDDGIYDIAPATIPTGYTQFLIEEDFSTLSNQTFQTTSSSQSSCGAGFWFFGASHSSK